MGGEGQNKAVSDSFFIEPCRKLYSTPKISIFQYISSNLVAIFSYSKKVLI